MTRIENGQVEWGTKWYLGKDQAREPLFIKNINCQKYSIEECITTF
jgi:hypothetical protein